jgi:hypothetical protein
MDTIYSCRVVSAEPAARSGSSVMLFARLRSDDRVVCRNRVEVPSGSLARVGGEHAAEPFTPLDEA